MRRRNPARAWRKLALVAALVLLAVGALARFVDAEAVDDLKSHLTLTLIMALVVLVNLVSFSVGAILFAAYKWIKRDLDPRVDD